jgi:hypothetical protein
VHIKVQEHNLTKDLLLIHLNHCVSKINLFNLIFILENIKQENKFEPPIASYSPNGMSYNYEQSVMSKSPGNIYDPAGQNSNGYSNNYKIVVESPIGPISSPNYNNPASPEYAAFSNDQIKNDGSESAYNPASPAYGNG